jgi:hypothetical protein
MLHTALAQQESTTGSVVLFMPASPFCLQRLKRLLCGLPGQQSCCQAINICPCSSAGRVVSVVSADTPLCFGTSPLFPAVPEGCCVACQGSSHAARRPTSAWAARSAQTWARQAHSSRLIRLQRSSSCRLPRLSARGIQFLSRAAAARRVACAMVSTASSSSSEVAVATPKQLIVDY